MIFVILSLLIVHPEEGEEVEDVFIVLSEYPGTSIPRIFIDERIVAGKYKRGDFTIVFFPSAQPPPGYHTLTIVTENDTVTVTFFMKGSRKERVYISAGFFYRYSGLELPYLSSHLHISRYENYYGFHFSPQFTVRRDTSYYYIPFYLYTGKSPWMVHLGSFYPLGYSPFLAARQINGIAIGDYKSTSLFWGKIPFLPRREVFGFSLGVPYLRLIGLRTQSLDTLEPFDNWVVGMETRFRFLSHGFILATGVSVYTRDMNRTWDVWGSNIPGWLFHVNATTIPMVPTLASSFLHLQARSTGRYILLKVNGNSFHNLASCGATRSMWLVKWTERIYVGPLQASTHLSLTNTGNIVRFMGRVGLAALGNRLGYSFLSPLSTHILDYFFKTPYIKTRGYFMISEPNTRVELSVVPTLPFEPGLTVEFSSDHKPVYSVHSQHLIFGVSIHPEIIYTGVFGFRVRASSSVFNATWNLAIFFMAENPSFQFQIARGFRL